MTLIQPKPHLFGLGEVSGIFPRKEALDAYHAVFDDPNIMPISEFLDLDRSLPRLRVHQIAPFALMVAETSSPGEMFQRL
ncbi:hypothetical protein [Mesorhizobium amorphae]|uniref:hypothetical protein n=1 Tax=Mesorhizobium amorphae TaxID=71433 RepID=UPI001780DB24|nr:hypothetical protein [Mesorhizobium amorphae]